MPLIFNKNIDFCKTRIVVWKNTESNDFYINQLELTENELNIVNSYKEHRQKEWFCSRYLVKSLVKDTGCHIIKDSYGKPILENSNCHISISHSQNRVAAVISDTPIGIDIQINDNKISRIHKKFISKKEILHLDQENQEACYHIFWGAKECMYKAWGKKELDFKKHMHIYAFKYFRKDLELKGWVKKNDEIQEYNIFTDMIDDFYLVYALQVGVMD